MKEVYAHIYQDIYSFREEQMAVARAQVSKNMAEMGISVDALKEMNVFNIGPGREAMAFHELGARNVHHVDVSEKPVNNFNALRDADPAFRNIHSTQQDICAATPLDAPEGIDFVYLSGVVHHLYDPARALHNIFAALNANATVFLRIYRSGSLGFFCADFVRQFVSYDDVNIVLEVFRERFPEDSEEHKILYDDMYDNFFVPIQNLYDPAEVNRFFVHHGFEIPVTQTFVAYDHADSRFSGLGNSLYYRLPGEYQAKAPIPFPRHEDQITDIPYREPFIRTTVEMMGKFLKIKDRIAAHERAAVAIEVYKLGQIKRVKGPVSALERHQAIQEILARHV